MTFYELTNSMTIQGNIEVVIYNGFWDEISRSRFALEDVFYSSRMEEDCDNLEVHFLYSTKKDDGEPWLVIELVKDEDEEDD